MRISFKGFVSLISILAVATPSLAGCATSLTRVEAERELVNFMLDSIIQGADGGQTDYVETIGELWMNAPPKAVLIIHAPPNKAMNKDPWEQLRTEKPIKVWWYFDNTLMEAIDKQAAIQKYAEQYMHNSYTWGGRYEFGILSISPNHRKAIVYSSLSACPECAGGSILTLERNGSGKWEIIASELLWLS